MSGIMHILTGVTGESIELLGAMAPYLLFGFFFAGLIHIFISTESIACHLGTGNFSSVIKASLFGVPLPLCSCGVIPAALSLRREGASIGATLAFLISTPTTGIDSIFATYALLGGTFTVSRIAASFLAGVLAGILANLFLKDLHRPGYAGQKKKGELHSCCEVHSKPARVTFIGKAKEVFRYAFVTLFNDVSRWILIGIVAGGVIAYAIPDGFFTDIFGNTWVMYIVMFAVGVPMYVCATGSIPIAASLVMKGLSPGAAFVFLVAGPATNAVTITVMMKELGKRATAIYLFAILVAAFGFGILLDHFMPVFGHASGPHAAMAHGPMLPSWVESVSAFVLLALIAYSMVKKAFHRHA